MEFRQQPVAVGQHGLLSNPAGSIVPKRTNFCAEGGADIAAGDGRGGNAIATYEEGEAGC